MKKTVIALSLLGSFAGPALAQSNATIYGVVDLGLANENNGVATKSSLDSGLQSGSRLGFKGTEDLGNGLKANFVLEMGILADTGASDQGSTAFGRQAFAGLSGEFGTANFGLQKSLTYTASEVIDPFSTGLAGNINRLFKTVTRRSNAVTYTSPNFSGFTGAAQYAFGNETPGNSAAGRTTAASGTYVSGPLSAVLTYEDVNDANGNTAVLGKKLLAGGVYDFGPAKLHAAYEVIKGSTSLTNLTGTEQRVWMIGTTVPAGGGNFIANYTGLSDQTVSNANANQLALGYIYPLSKRTNLYTSASRTTNGSKSSYNAAVKGGTDRLVNAGVRVLF